MKRASINPFFRRIAASRVGFGHCFAVSHRLRRYEPSPQLCCRSLLAYLFDMWLQHNLKISLRRNKPLCGVLSRRSLCGSLRFIPQNEFLEAP